MASLFFNQQLPTTSEQALREFREKYLAIVSAAQPTGWHARFVETVAAPRVTYPLSAFSTKFLETKEENSRFKGMEEKSFDLKVVEYDAGFEARWVDLKTNTFAYRNWGRAPAEMRTGEERLEAKNLATLLEGGTSTVSPWDGVAFFHASGHLCNPFDSSVGTFGNYQSSTLDVVSIANIQAEITNMMLVKDVNGDKLNVYPTQLWVPTQKYQKVTDLLNQANLATGETNPLKGKLEVVHIPELTDVNDWYLVDTNLIARGYDPMICTSYVPDAALGLREWDQSSDFFKDTGKIKVSQHIWKGFGLLFPHAIRRVAGA